MKNRNKQDFYAVLGVTKKANDADLKRAYRDLARQFHPDLNSGSHAEERFKEISEAYGVLSDAKSRQHYDRFGHSIAGSGETVAGFVNVVDAFDDLFGDILKRRRKPKERGKELRYTLEVTLEEAAFGCEKTIVIPQKDGTNRTFVIVVAIGSEEGAIRRIRGEGQSGVNGGANGDLHVILRVKDHDVLRREGYEIWCEVSVSFPQAALGAVVEVPCLDGHVKMRVPEGTQSGRILRMRGRGVPKSSSNGTSRGDQLVRIVVETPTSLSARQRTLLERFESDAGTPVSHAVQRGFVGKIRSLFGE